MEKPLTLIFRNIERSELLVSMIEAKCRKLERFYPQIISTHVMVELPHRHHRHGNFFDVKVEVTVPGQRLVISHSPGQGEKHQALDKTLKDTFQAMSRRIEDYARCQRGDVKTHTAWQAA